MNIRDANELSVDLMALRPPRIACARAVVFTIERETSGSTEEGL